MKTKKQQELVKKQARRLHERVGALMLLCATLVGVATVSQEARQLLKYATIKPALTVICDPGKENETTRMPVQYGTYLKAQTISSV